jgi:DNA-binding transcriptional LysR family regulator
VAADLSAAQLRAFLLVVDHGSYRAAAGRAFRSQPAISLAIRQLESRLGGALFEPDAQVRLTPYGERCVPLARELLGQHERLVAAKRRLARPDQGSLAIAVLPSVASQWLPDLLIAFGARHPGVSVRVLDDNSRNIQAQVASGKADFGICSLSDTVTDLATTALVRGDGSAGHRVLPGTAVRVRYWPSAGRSRLRVPDGARAFPARTSVNSGLASVQPPAAIRMRNGKRPMRTSASCTFLRTGRPPPYPYGAEAPPNGTPNRERALVDRGKP